MWWHRQFGEVDLEARLRASRAVPAEEFVRKLAGHVRGDARPAPRSRARLALAGALTAGMLTALASAGGIGYAASAAEHAARQATKTVGRLLAVSEPSDVVVVRGLSAGGDQYLPAFQFGAPAHNHAGPPGLRRAGGPSAPPLRARLSADGKRVIVTTRVLIDEQADLAITVVGPDGKRLLLRQKDSRVGLKLGGAATKTIRYRLLIPRVIRLTIAIPSSLVETGKRYKIRLVATDPSGLTSTLKIPFIL